ncbi:MAG: hypothetical protein ACI9VR_002035 [Cognaticolwellia sp.]|jgi:hypothetical protein
MPDATLLLGRLRGEPKHMQDLVNLVLEDLLERPLAELVDPKMVGDALLKGLRSSLKNPGTKSWIGERLQQGIAQLKSDQRSLLRRVPREAVEPVQDLLQRPYSPDPQMLRAMVDHQAMRNLMREVLTHSLTDFASLLRPPTKALGTGRLAQWAGAASVAAKMVGSEVERQLEGRIRVYVDGAISHAIGIAVENICDPKNADEYGKMRSDMVDVALAFPVSTWGEELAKLEPIALVDDVHQILSAAAASEELEKELRDVLERMVQEQGHLSARTFLEGSGLEESWRPPLQTLMLSHTRHVVESQVFADWLHKVCE